MTTLEFKSTGPAIAKDELDKLDWTRLNVETLPSDLRKAYELYREANAVAKQYKDQFAAMFRAGVVAPTGQQVLLGYRYGKLAYAFAPLSEAKSKAKLVSFSSIAKR